MRTAISKSVGNRGINLRDDVVTVQTLLNNNIGKLTPLAPLTVDGAAGKSTVRAIEEFQRRVMGIARPDGRVDPDGSTLAALDSGKVVAVNRAVSGVFSHPDAARVTLKYGTNARALTAKAEYLLKSILASCGIFGATITSSRRTYRDQARITLTETYKSSPEKVKTWYGQSVLEACKKYVDDTAGLATWWEAYDKRRGRVSSRHLSNRALDVVPSNNRGKFAAKVTSLIPVSGSGVRRIIPKGVMGEPVDHVEFTFDVCS